MIQVNAIGDACPIPVVKTLNALKELGGAGTVQTLVDNEIAVQNLTRLAESKSCTIETEKRSEKEFCVTITTQARLRRQRTRRFPAPFRRRKRKPLSLFPPTTWARAARSLAAFSSRAFSLR